MRTTIVFTMFAAAATLGCGPGYAGENCKAVQLGTRASDLPVWDGGSWELYGFPIRGPALRCSCCTRQTTDPNWPCTEDCSAPEYQAHPVTLGGKYEGEPCNSNGSPGDGHCVVWVLDGGVVAVQAFCQD